MNISELNRVFIKQSKLLVRKARIDFVKKEGWQYVSLLIALPVLLVIFKSDIFDNFFYFCCAFLILMLFIACSNEVLKIMLDDAYFYREIPINTEIIRAVRNTNIAKRGNKRLISSLEKSAKSISLFEMRKIIDSEIDIDYSGINVVDPIAEADLYLSYGFNKAAEEILKDALSKDPMDYDIHLKLLQLYSNKNEVAVFERCVKELKAIISDSHPIWLKVKELSVAMNSNVSLHGA